MAFIISNKFPVDTLPDVAVGVSIPFSGNQGTDWTYTDRDSTAASSRFGDEVFNQTFITRDQIKSNLINFFLTNRGERYMNPGFGGDLRNLLFQAISSQTLDNLENQIKDQLASLFPTVRVNNLVINSLPDRNLVQINLAYRVLNQPLDELQINFNNDGV